MMGLPFLGGTRLRGEPKKGARKPEGGAREGRQRGAEAGQARRSRADPRERAGKTRRPWTIGSVQEETRCARRASDWPMEEHEPRRVLACLGKSLDDGEGRVLEDLARSARGGRT